MQGPQYFDETPRVLKGDGVHSVDRFNMGTTILLKCKGCEWKYQTLGFFEDFAEQAAYMHITKPNLAILGSSDILTSSRIRRAEMQNHPLFRKEKS